MTSHLRRSRVTKALTDRTNGAGTFDAAEKRLSAVRVAIALMPDQSGTAAGQAAALTAVNTSVKCFGSATLVGDPRTALAKRLQIGDSLGTAASTLGSRLAATIPDDATHVVVIGNAPLSAAQVFARCWWNGWTAGVVPAWDDRALGRSNNPLAGTFSGALAIREVFATVLGYPRSGSRVAVTSLWEPGSDPEMAGSGPERVYISPRMWLIGLGHLGQGFLWSLGMLPAIGIEAVLQDDQDAGEENEATGLLTRSADIRQRKTRIAARWLEGAGWLTRLIERRHYGDIPRLGGDPAIVITGLDEPGPRIQIANAGFEYLIDAGIGHGPVDFEALQIRVLKKGADAGAFWSSPEPKKNVDKLMEREPYRAHQAESDRCGTLTLANASVAVPFVGAAAGALTVSQAIRLASMQSTVQIMQMELGSPDMVIIGGMNSPPTESWGSLELLFHHPAALERTGAS